MFVDLKSELEGVVSVFGWFFIVEIVICLEWLLEFQLLDQVYLLYKNLGEVWNLVVDLDGLIVDIKCYEVGQCEVLRWFLEDEVIFEDCVFVVVWFVRDMMNEWFYVLCYLI